MQTGSKRSWENERLVIESIFSPDGLDEYKNKDLNDKVVIFPKYIKYISKSAEYPTSKIKMNRGKVVAFTRKSRSRLIQFMASIFETPTFWQAFTFPDDVMTNKNETERSLYSSKVLKAFKRKLESVFTGNIKINAVWRRDWEFRKSGTLIGQRCPHFHCIVYNDFFNEENLMMYCHKMAEIWVECLNTNDFKKALKVAKDEKSYQLLDTSIKSQKYISKYMGKLNSMNPNKESLGRFWGTIGDIKTVEGINFYISDSEAIHLKRMLRTKIGKRSISLLKVFRAQNKNGWALIRYESFIKFMEFVKDGNFNKILNEEIKQ